MFYQHNIIVDSAEGSFGRFSHTVLNVSILYMLALVKNATKRIEQEKVTKTNQHKLFDGCFGICGYISISAITMNELLMMLK